MKTAEELRAENIKRIADDLGRSAVCNKLGISDSQLSQMINRSLHSVTKKPRNIGTEKAREIEETFGKPIGWLDHPHDVTEISDLAEEAARVMSQLPRDDQLDLLHYLRRHAMIKAKISDDGTEPPPAPGTDGDTRLSRRPR